MRRARAVKEPEPRKSRFSLELPLAEARLKERAAYLERRIERAHRKKEALESLSTACAAASYRGDGRLLPPKQSPDPRRDLMAQLRDEIKETAVCVFLKSMAFMTIASGVVLFPFYMAMGQPILDLSLPVAAGVGVLSFLNAKRTVEPTSSYLAREVRTRLNQEMSDLSAQRENVLRKLNGSFD